MKALTLLTALLLFFIGFTQNEIDASYKKMLDKKYDFPTISQDDAEKKIGDAKVVFLDTREWGEFNVSHIPGAVFVGYDHIFWKNIDVIDKNKEIIVYCSIGVRSQNIGRKLKEKGFTNVKNLYGGIFLWADQGRPMQNQTGNKTKIVHAYDKFWGRWVKKAEKVYE